MAKVNAAVAILFAVCGLLGALLLGAVYRQIRDESYRWLDRTANNLAASVANQAKEHITYFDFKALQAMLERTLEQDPSLAYCEVAFGAQLAKKQSAGNPGAGELREYRYDLRDGEELVARVTLRFSTRLIRQGLDSLRWGLMAGILGSCIVLMLALSLLVAHFIRPIERLRQVALHIAAGELSSAEQMLRPLLGAAPQRGAGKGDEVEQLSQAFVAMLASLREGTSMLKESEKILAGAVEQLVATSSEQTVTAQQQAQMLEAAQSDALATESSSKTTAREAQALLSLAARAEALGELGAASVERSERGLAEIRTEVEGVADRTTSLTAQVAEIGGLARMVEELADRSHLLALNAAIEASRVQVQAGAVSIVATEMRALSESSIGSARRIQKLLGQIVGDAKQSLVSTQAGMDKVASNLTEVSGSRSNLTELLSLFNEHAAGVRQIVTTVEQQASGMASLAQAVVEASKLTADAARQVTGNTEIVRQVEQAAQRLSQVAGRYKLG